MTIAVLDNDNDVAKVKARLAEVERIANHRLIDNGEVTTTVTSRGSLLGATPANSATTATQAARIMRRPPCAGIPILRCGRCPAAYFNLRVICLPNVCRGSACNLAISSLCCLSDRQKIHKIM